jgi:hypothetical protein
MNIVFLFDGFDLETRQRVTLLTSTFSPIGLFSETDKVINYVNFDPRSGPPLLHSTAPRQPCPLSFSRDVPCSVGYAISHLQRGHTTHQISEAPQRTKCHRALRQGKMYRLQYLIKQSHYSP